MEPKATKLIMEVSILPSIGRGIVNNMFKLSILEEMLNFAGEQVQDTFK